MTGRYDFRARTKAVHAATESKLEAKTARKRRLSEARESARQTKRHKIEKEELENVRKDEAAVAVVGETIENERQRTTEVEREILIPAAGKRSEIEVEIPQKPEVVDIEMDVVVPAVEGRTNAGIKIPGLTLLEGETVNVEMTGISSHNQNPLISTKVEDKPDAVQNFEASLTSYLQSADAVQATAPAAKEAKRPLRGNIEKTRTSKEGFERAQVRQEVATKELEAATDSLALGEYLLNVFAVSKLPLREPLKHDFRSFLPGMNMASDTPIEDFPWIKVDWTLGKDSQVTDTPVVSPGSTPHTVSIYMLPNEFSSLEEAVQVYSRTFDHRVESCPNPLLCPLCRYRGREGLVPLSEEIGSRTSSIVVEQGSASSLFGAVETTTIIVSAPNGVPSTPDQRSETNCLPAESSLKPSVPATYTRMVGVSIFRTKGNQVGDVQNLETYQCESFDDFKEQIRVAFEDVFKEAGWRFESVLYEKFSLMNRGTNILNTDVGDSPGTIWKRFVSLLEAGATKEENAKGVVGSVDIIIE